MLESLPFKRLELEYDAWNHTVPRGSRQCDNLTCDKPLAWPVRCTMQIKLLVTTLTLFFTSAIAEPRVAPDWTLQSVGGETITLSEVVAKQPVIVVFWATWCPYCKALMPHVQSIRLEYGDKVEVLAVHFRDDNGDPVAFMENAAYDFTVLPDGDDVAELNGIWGTPGVLIVDRDMNVRFDRYELPDYDLPAAGKPPSHGKKAAYKAPYWAAEIRRALDTVLSDVPK